MKRGLTGSAVTAHRSSQASDSHRKNVDCIIKKFLQWVQDYAIDVEKAHVDSIVSCLNPWRDQGKLSTEVATASAMSTVPFAVRFIFPVPPFWVHLCIHFAVRGWSSHHFQSLSFLRKKKWGILVRNRLSGNFCWAEMRPKSE